MHVQRSKKVDRSEVESTETDSKAPLQQQKKKKKRRRQRKKRKQQVSERVSE